MFIEYQSVAERIENDLIVSLHQLKIYYN